MNNEKRRKYYAKKRKAKRQKSDSCFRIVRLMFKLDIIDHMDEWNLKQVLYRLYKV